MRTELLISWRYLLTKRKEKFISLISVISVMGVSIGVAALIIVIAVMSGFDRDLREKIVGNYSHLTISGYKGISNADYENISGKIKNIPHIVSLSPYVQGQVLAKEAERYFAVGLKGIDPEKETKVTKLAQYLVKGSVNDLSNGAVIIGKELAAYLGLRLNSNLSVVSALGKPYSLKVVGIFKSGMYDYDLNLIFTDLKTSQEILGLGDKISAIAVKLDDLYLADKIAPQLSNLLGYDYMVKTWTQSNENFFAALKLEKLTMFIILTLIILVASFNIISTLIVMVVEKTKDIGILMAIGMNPGQIRRIFTYQGLMIGSLGTFFGASIGVLLCWLLKKYQFIQLPQDIYYIDHLPVAIDWSDMGLVVMAAMAITIISTIYPASKAASFKPVEALRYE
ncbi:MAG: ABC transporter permease [Candidatus Omnitrophica bacterium]|nr:ABC transporter permease [Candidatus Omnitrophota bacterium]MDD5653249.1 ABC transporter permease [Candidatus Omnitrophota bacterium]